MVCSSHGRSPWTQTSCHRANPAMSKRRTSGKRLLKVQENPRWLEKLKSQRKIGRSASLLAEPLIVHGFFMILSNSSRVRRMHSVLQDYSSLPCLRSAKRALEEFWEVKCPGIAVLCQEIGMTLSQIVLCGRG